MNQAQVDLKKVATGDFSGGGLLNAKQAEKFLNFVIDESVLKNSARIILMNERVQEIDKVGVGARVAKAKVENVAPTSGNYVSINTDQVVLTTQSIIVPWSLSFESLQDNIEREGFEDTMLQMIAAQLANDLEELFLQGDTASNDPYLALMDGWIKLCVGAHQATYAGTGLAKEVFSKLKRALPTKYRRNNTTLRYFVNMDDEQDYRDSLSNRDTNLGDAVIVGNQSMTVYGIPVVPVPLMPQGTVILTHEKNFIVGMHKQGIRLEKDKDIMKGQNLYAIHMRVACEIENIDCVAFIDGIPPA